MNEEEVLQEGFFCQNCDYMETNVEWNKGNCTSCGCAHEAHVAAKVVKA